MDLISALQTFLRVAETGSFSAAAQERRRTQPAISRQISALERHLNTRLLHRTTSGIALTDEGRALIPLATRVVEAAEDLGDAAGSSYQQASGKVRLNVPAPLGPIDELLRDLPEAQPVRDAWRKGFEPIDTAAKAGEAVQATKLFFEWVNNQGPGAFDTQPEAFRQMILDNARTVPLARSAPRPPAISCATLGGVKAPTLVVGGEQTPRYLALINEVVVQCIPGSRLVVIPKATHLMSHQNPTAFNEALLHFLTQQ